MFGDAAAAPRVWLVSILLLAILPEFAQTQAATSATGESAQPTGTAVTGTVVARVGDELRVEVDPGQLTPELGDLVIITWPIGGRVLDGGQAKVTGVSADMVTAQITDGKPNKGMEAVIWVIGPEDAFQAGETLYLAEEPEDRDLLRAHRQSVVEWYLKAATSGHVGAGDRLVEMWYSERTPAYRDVLVRDAEEIFAEAARRGSPDAQLALGSTFLRGSKYLVISAKPIEAVAWLRLAAAQGSAEARRYLGDAYQYGDGVPLDHERAHVFYEEAIEGGSIDALYAMSMHLATGDDHRSSKGDWKNAKKKSFAILKRGAEAGQCFAIYDLAGSYIKGEWFSFEVKQDEKKGLEWHRKGARSGCAMSQSKLKGMGESW